jgi:hypothetical protein
MTTKVRINRQTGKPISRKIQQGDAIQKVIYEQPGRTVVEIYARVLQLFPGLDITEKRVESHVTWGTDPTKRKAPWLKYVGKGRIHPAIDIRPEWQL